MEVRFRSFSFLDGRFVGEPAVNLPGKIMFSQMVVRNGEFTLVKIRQKSPTQQIPKGVKKVS